jgi:hypothetical protein
MFENAEGLRHGRRQTKIESVIRRQCRWQQVTSAGILAACSPTAADCRSLDAALMAGLRCRHCVLLARPHLDRKIEACQAGGAARAGGLGRRLRERGGPGGQTRVGFACQPPKASSSLGTFGMPKGAGNRTPRFVVVHPLLQGSNLVAVRLRIALTVVWRRTYGASSKPSSVAVKRVGTVSNMNRHKRRDPSACRRVGC